MLARLDRTGRRVGIDLSTAMIEEARRRLGGDAELSQMDAEVLSFPDASFDHVLCASALQQLPHPQLAVRHFHRVLRPGGVAAVSIFGAADPRWRGKDNLIGRLAGPLPRVGTRLDRPGLEELFANAGFEEVGVDAEHLDVVFADAEAWLQNAWSHGERRAFEAMDEAAYTAFRAALPDALASAREADGWLHWRPELLFAVAVKPA